MGHTTPERQALAHLLIGKTDGILRPRFYEHLVEGDRMKLKRWRDSGMPEEKLDELLEQLQKLIGPALGIPRKDEKSPPAWAEGLIEQTVRRVLDDKAMDALLDRAQERAEVLRGQQASDHDVNPASQHRQDDDASNARPDDQ